MVKKITAILSFLVMVNQVFSNDFYKATTALNLRTGEGVGYQVITTIPQGSEVEYLSFNNETGWVGIIYEGHQGYVSKDYLVFSRTGESGSMSKEQRDEYIQIGIGLLVVLLFGWVLVDKIASQPKPQLQPIEQQVQQPVIAKQKSMAVAFLLAFFFGPFGLLYATVTGGLVMILTPVAITVVSILMGSYAFLLLSLFLYVGCVWLVSVIWALIAVNSYNSKQEKLYLYQVIGQKKE